MPPRRFAQRADRALSVALNARPASRLDALATVASQLQQCRGRTLGLASIATMHAVALETLQAERAEAIWREAHERHPELPEVVVELPERIAA